MKRPVVRSVAILEVLGDEKLTAREIAKRMGFSDMNAVRPRLTEMMGQGLVQVLGKVTDETTGRKVAVYERC